MVKELVHVCYLEGSPCSIQVSREGIPTASSCFFNVDTESTTNSGTNIVISTNFTLATNQTIVWSTIGY